MTVLVEAEGLVKCFGPIVAVDGISLAVKRGEVLGFLGPNGAGKSTTMKMISGFLEADRGRASICGYDVEQDPKGAKTRLGYLPEGAPSYGEMTPRAFLSFIAEIRGYSGQGIAQRVDRAIELAALHGVVDQRIETLSKGYKRRVGIAHAILHDPPVLIMDEPTDGLDPNQKHHVRNLIKTMAAEKAIIVSTHILEEVEAVCTRAVIINKGRIVADGTADDLLAKLPPSGAVNVRIPVDKAEAALKVLSGLKDIASVTQGKVAGGMVALKASPKNGEKIAPIVAAALKEKALPFEEVFLDRPNLDDVFREITAKPGSRPNA